MLVKIVADIPPLVAPPIRLKCLKYQLNFISKRITQPIPTRSTSNLSSKTFLDTDAEIVVLILLARVVGKVELNVFGHRDPVVRIHRLVRDNLDPRSRDAPLVVIDDEELLKEGLVKKKGAFRIESTQ